MYKYLRTFAEINLDAIENNFNELKKYVNNNVKLCAVVKADGYGHGAVEIANFLKDKADCFAVATTDEAIELRRNNITNPILILTHTHYDDYKILIEKNIELTVFTSESAIGINSVAKQLNKIARIHIAIDTGMSRIGFNLSDDSVKTVKEISELENIKIVGVFSHYACADMRDKTTGKLQTERYIDFVNKCKITGVEIPVQHMCNSAAISESDEHFDMVRMGIALYGLYPSDEVDKSKLNLIPAMSFKSHITHIKDVPAGEGISYGHTYKTTKTQKIATVAAGYADGFPRALSNIGRVLIRGKFAPITGRVCMDQFMVDVSDIPDATVNDEVILFGTDGKNTVSAEEIGDMSMSFNYEVICSISRRVPRIYKKNSETFKTVNYLR